MILIMHVYFCNSSQINEFSSQDRALQFLSTVASTDSIFVNRPVGASITELLQYILKEETKATAENGSYSGVHIEKVV